MLTECRATKSGAWQTYYYRRRRGICTPRTRPNYYYYRDRPNTLQRFRGTRTGRYRIKAMSESEYGLTSTE